MIKIAMLSAWHVHAKGYAREIAANDNCTITAVWDENAERGKQWASELSCRFFDDIDELLSAPDIDAVALNAPTDMHAQLLVKAANAGKHIFTEKILTLETRQALEVKAAVEKSGIHFTISFPHKTNDALQFLKKLIASGALGDVTYARVRNCHSGSVDNWLPAHFYDKKQCGGGAMIDLGAHPMYLLEWFLGKPVSVQSLFTNVTDRPVEDNAVCLIEFAGGAVGVSETGFVSRCDQYTVEVSGTKGAFCLRSNDAEYCTVDTTDKKWVKIPENHYSIPSPINYWLDSIKNDTPNELYSIDEAVSLTALMQAAYESFDTGKRTPVTL